VRQIEQTVVGEVHKLIPNAIALACGSYRRGKLSSGDCDVLITDPDADMCDILPKLLERLHASGFLTGTSRLQHVVAGSDSVDTLEQTTSLTFRSKRPVVATPIWACAASPRCIHQSSIVTRREN